MSEIEYPTVASRSDAFAISVLPLRDVVVYPHMVVSLFVGREKSIHALDVAMSANKQILLVTQRTADTEDPSQADLYGVGTASKILQLLKLPDNTIKVLVEGVDRARIIRLSESTGGFFTAAVELLTDSEVLDEKETEVLSRSVIGLFDQYAKLNKKISPEILTSLAGIDDASRLADTVIAHMTLKINEKQRVLELAGTRARLEHLIQLIEDELDLLQLSEKRIFVVGSSNRWKKVNGNTI